MPVSPSSIPLRRSPLPNPSSHPPRSYLGFPHLPLRRRRWAVQEGSADTMVELKLGKENLFPNVLEAILDLVDVASVYCSSTGLTLQAVDAKHVGGITLLFPPEVFQHYRCDSDVSMCIPIDNLVKAIRSAHKDDVITMVFDEYSYDSITLHFDSPSENITMDYDLELVDASIHIPDRHVLYPKYQTLGKMPSAQFMHVCKGLGKISNDGHISVTEKGLEFFALRKNALGEEWRVDITCIQILNALMLLASVHSWFLTQPEKATDIAVTIRAPVSFTLDLKYMNSFAKVSALFNQQVKICLSETGHLMGECKIEETGYIRYFLASKDKTDIEKEDIKDEGSAEEMGGSKEIKGSGEGKEGIKESEDGRDQ
ncbi:hypothetical protein EJB05_07177 [Eragrostis curvula]|uniref:DNA sliding clamp PCNA n=1 Tax=Eragrostis curvula TaxID=38414 RepID=A0A5J9WHP3_9POAL|nr:hypothetical protein EJB05_07177 [Eragrostis curvula]